MKQDKTYYSLRSFLRFFGLHKKAFALTLGAFLISSIAISLVPFFIGALVQAASNGAAAGDIMFYTWILVALSSSHDLLWRVAELLHRHYINPLRFKFETAMFRHIIAKPYPYFVDKFSGKISGNISVIYAELRDLLGSIFYAYVPQIISIATTAAILASVNWQTLVLFLLGVTGMVVVGQHTIKKANLHEGLTTDRESTKHGIIIDSIANFASVKSFHKELTELASVKNAQDITLANAQAAYVWAIVFWASMSFFVRHLIWPIAILMNVHFFLQGELSVGQLATLLSTVLLFAGTVWDIIWHASQLNLKLARTEEAHRYLFGSNVFDTTASSSLPASPLQLEYQLEVRNLTFSYPDKPDTPVLKDINLTIKKGEKIGVVGRSGGGKTTLVKLLLDYYELEPGHLFADNKSISARSVAHAIAYVPQDTSLFHRSVAENIAYAASEATREEVIEAAKKAHAHEFISDIEGGYDALVGERGIKLSGGQRQRIAIARAVLSKAPILVLDEATSALDSESELLIQDALWELMKDRTAIVIAHRLSTIQKMDRIIVLDKGSIIEQGSHQELLNQNGVYAKLWAHQSGGFIEE